MHRAFLHSVLATLTTFCALSAQAASYQFTGPLYSSVANYTPPCTTGTCADYSVAMRVTGWFTTAAPLASNLVGADVSALVIAYSFSDGIRTIGSADGAARRGMFNVWTDGGGQITDSTLTVWSWQDGLAGPHAASNRISVIPVTTAGDNSANNLGCTAVGISFGVADSCTAFFIDSETSSATNDAGGTWTSVPDVTIDSVSANEGNAGTTNFTFTVSLSSVPAAPVSLNWFTADGTATDGSDYTAGWGVLNWAAGDGAAKTITVQVSGDGAVEANETFTVNLNNATGAGLASAQGMGTITNDDLPPPDLALTKTDGAASTVPGATVAYTLTCANTNGQAASGVTLTETVPANTTFNAGASTAGWVCLPNANAGSTCTYSVGGLAVGASQVATFAVTVASPLSEAVTQIANTASCTDDGSHGADPVPADNSATDTDAVVHPQVPPTLGNVPDQSGTVGTAFSLALAPWVTLTNGDAITGYAIASGSLPPGLTLDAGSGIISGIPTAAGTYDLTVTASDDDGVSNSDAVRMTISAAAVSTARPVPTLTEWGTLLLAGLLLASTLRLPTSRNCGRR